MRNRNAANNRHRQPVAFQMVLNNKSQHPSLLDVLPKDAGIVVQPH